MLTSNCKKETNPQLPTVTTDSLTNITSVSATCGGIVEQDGGATVTSRGVCWDYYDDPTDADGKTTDGNGTGRFTSSITELEPNLTYNVWAYATNSVGTSYGKPVTFTTLQGIQVPILTTTNLSNITQTTAISGGSIISNGGDPITASGVCWGTDHFVSILDDNFTTDGTETGSFLSNITGLNINTLYYMAAYATNSAGTGYGNIISFQTLFGSDILFNSSLSYGNVTDVDGNIYKTVEIGTQTWMAENLRTTKFNDNANIPLVTDSLSWSALISPGYCWYNNNEVLHKNVFGALYNWYTVESNKICPTGWHVPTADEWTTLVDYLGGYLNIGDKLREAGSNHWGETESSNETGFTALPGGRRVHNSGYTGESDGSFQSLLIYGYWWTNNEVDSENAKLRSMQSHLFGHEESKKMGVSVRCVKD